MCTEDLSGYKCNCKDGFDGINCEGMIAPESNTIIYFVIFSVSKADVKNLGGGLFTCIYT